MDNTLAATTAELATLLQDVHFAARALEERTAAGRQDRLVDRIHAARLVLERLRFALTRQSAA